MTFNETSHTALFDLPADQCRKWLLEGRTIWRCNPIFFLLISLIVVWVRSSFDEMTGGYFILLSYFSDALLFAWLFLGLKNRTEKSAWSLIAAGFRSVNGRMFKVIATGIWGIPAAITSYLIFLIAPEIIKMVVVLNGDPLIATFLLFLALCLGGIISLLLAMVPVLAGIQMARDPSATLQSSGLWAYRGLLAGLRPITVLFMVLLSTCLILNFVVSFVIGHIPLVVLQDFSHDGFMQVLLESQLTVLFVMNGFLAVLYPLVRDLLGSADTDLSDEIFSDSDKVVQGDAFWTLILERAGQALRVLSVMSVVFLSIYAVFEGYDEAGNWFVYSVVSYILGGSFRKSAQGWREGLSWWVRYRFLITPIALAILIATGFSLFDDPGSDNTSP
jgi:hypothetical protein